MHAADADVRSACSHGHMGQLHVAAAVGFIFYAQRRPGAEGQIEPATGLI